ncbi:NmrA-like family domain-containing protein 1 [Galdieria sulphuraria]|uniref:NmrA-like family domain-containing protein 1 n=1 Tax=Galdieria sulphuraria TaxID=130081 RepID=M2VV89_GALSU|nr:NmrA-like family domain-containing protein 1 [Galdieria sulphuraria]EME27131.1 NmrA-like family domain-containing protein 1 [Galdieria sulphuraria]GJD09388.1 NmrA-like family domain-containing protein 1 [Galdieria sulphuraria]|eukprot:XP_005703651.1 NmrA-like family domain-containing protein 1 [Galdieria sulphuraria]
MPTILVFGATGRQGGSVVEHLIGKGWKVRAVTRNPSSEAAQLLVRKGAEVLQGDLLQPPETLLPLFRNTDAAFGVTDFRTFLNDSEGPDRKEFLCGKNFADAAKMAKVPYPIFSSLPSTKRLTNEKYATRHFETKVIIEEHMKNIGLPVIIIRLYAYFENLRFWLRPKKENPEQLEFSLPMGSSRMFMTCVEDVGGVVAGILEQPAEYINRTIDVVHSSTDLYQVAEVLSKSLDKEVHYIPQTIEQFKSLSFPFANDLADMFASYQIMFDDEHIIEFDIETCRRLYPKYHTLEQWARKYKQQLIGLEER